MGTGDSLYSETTPDTAADPSGGTTTYTYYPGGAADTTTTPAGTTTDSYDGLGDLTAKTYSNTASGYSTPADVSYSYYPSGSRESMTDGTGTTTYGTDAMGDVTSQAFSAASGSGLSSNTVGYSYFSTGQLETVSYPSYGSFENPTVTYSYDQLGHMASETDWLGNEVTFSHDADGNLVSQDDDVSPANPNGTSSTIFSYDNTDENTQATTAEVCSGSPGTLTQLFSGSGGSRNADGEVTEDSEVYGGACSGQASYERNYSYDLAGQVIYQGSMSQGSSAGNFSYDPAGNPTEISSHDGSGNFDTYDQSFDSAGEVTGQTPVAGSSGSVSSYTFDTLGDLTSTTAGSSTTTYGYDQLGEMTSAAAGQTTTYQYTGDGLEAGTSTGSVSLQLTWNSTGSLPLVLSDGANDYVYGSTDEPDEQVNTTSAPPTANPLFLTYTPSDSSWTVTTASGQQVSFYRYDATARSRLVRLFRPSASRASTRMIRAEEAAGQHEGSVVSGRYGRVHDGGPVTWPNQSAVLLRRRRPREYRRPYRTVDGGLVCRSFCLCLFRRRRRHELPAGIQWQSAGWPHRFVRLRSLLLPEPYQLGPFCQVIDARERLEVARCYWLRDFRI